tara:strand:+ start:42148 stop:43872 length:1725 start_codon:yes stop_codon:yes gene_type:complete
MDAFVVKSICDEIYPLIKQSKLSQVREVGRFCFILQFYSQKGHNYNLLISADNKLSRLHLTSKKMISVKKKTNFIQNLKKYLEGSLITKIHSGNWERIVQISFTTKSKDQKSYALIIELLGHSNNILLLDGQTGEIIDSMKRQRSSSNLSNNKPFKYILPPLSKKKSLDEIDDIFLKRILLEKKKDNLDIKQFKDLLVKNILGISPVFAEIISTNNKDLLYLLEEIRNSYLSSSFSPAIIFSENDIPKNLLAYGKLLKSPYKYQLFERMNDAAETYFSSQLYDLNLAYKKKKLTSSVLSQIKRKEKTKKQINLDLEKSKAYKKFKKKGDLIISNLGNVSLKSNSFQVIDGNDKIEIVINPRFSLSENAERFYKKYKKYKRMRSIGKKRFEMVKEEIIYLKTILLDIEETESIGDFSDLENSSEFLKLNYSEEKTKFRRKIEKTKPFFYFKFSEGYEIFAGKNALGNEMILRNLGNKDDLWFHARGMPGSHVLLRAEQKHKKKDYKSKMIIQAASIAAYYSKSKENIKIRVSYLPFKNLRRPKGNNFGKVVFRQHKTILASPEIGEKLVKSFRKN